MARNVTDEPGVGRSLEDASGGQPRCESGEALVEWRSCEQVENGIPSTSPPYWDSDDDDDDGLKPSELYGKYTWKIDKFSQINKRELRSNAFEVGGYKWYILIYPQGCDVCNHLSLFLCVANHDKLLPGWSHFAQFTIAVVNKDPKKSKYSDTLHRFWKKEHDWGWKKFMELSKVLDGFIDADTLIIKAQVQVIRERADRPFRCLDCQYRRELVRVYLTNVEQICRRFVEERRCKLGKLIEDKVRWTSFCAFWLGMDQSARRRMSREKTDAILKVVVKHFFIEKEVTSTLVMDSLYSGLKALEGQTKSKKGKGIHLDAEELPVPVVHMEKDTFVLVDDVLLLLERVAVEPLPPKDEKGPQNRTKEGSSGEDFSKDSIERDERRLTELGRRTIEIFVLAHIFSSKIEVAYQEAVALKRQEELIREEEAAWLAGSEQKAKRGGVDKEKKSKKKQGKQKRNNRKAKDKQRDEKSDILVEDINEEESPNGVKKDDLVEESEGLTAKLDAAEDISDISDSLDCAPEVHLPDSEERDASPVNWDTDASEVNPPTEASSSGVSALSAAQSGVGGRSPSVMDDSSSTCSTDSVASVVINGPRKGDHMKQKSPNRGRNLRSKTSSARADWANGTHSDSFEAVSDARKLNDASGVGRMAEPGPQTTVPSSKERGKSHEQNVTKGEESPQPRKGNAKTEVDAERPSTSLPPSAKGLTRDIPFVAQLNTELKHNASVTPVPDRKSASESPTRQATESGRLKNSAETMGMPSRSVTPKLLEKPSVQQVPVAAEKLSTSQVPVMSRPLSAPLVPGQRPTAPVVSMVQPAAPLLARSVSAAGRLGPDPSTASHSYIPQSYRNAMMGNPVAGTNTGFPQPSSPSSSVNSSHSYSQPPTPMSAPMFLPQGSERTETSSIRPHLSFGMLNREVLQNGSQWIDCSPRDSRSIPSDRPSLNEIRNFDAYHPLGARSQDQLLSEFQACTSGRQTHGALADEFPHLDIINDLLDDEHGMGMATLADSSFQSFSNGPHHMNRQYSFPGEVSISNDLNPLTSSCRFERTRSYHEDSFQRSYGFPGGPFEPTRDMLPHSNPHPYANGQIDGLVPNQWQMSSSDLSFLSMRNTENDGYSYHVPDYPNLTCGVNGYGLFRPSSGL